VSPPATPISVSVSPSSTSLTSGGTQQFTASVQGTSNTAVNWASSSGTISSGGLFTAPIVTSSVTVNITASSVADPTQSASASVVVSGSGTTSGGPSTTGSGDCGAAAAGASA